MGKIMNNIKSDKTIKKYISKFLAIIFWLGVWFVGSKLINNTIVLASPLEVFTTLITLCQSFAFWLAILHSFSRIVLGLILGLLAGTVLAVLSYRSFICYELISPFMKVVKSTPIASFTILALMWIQSKNLSVLISFLMVVPIVYTNILQGIHSADEKLLQMAKVFGLSAYKKLIAIYIPSVFPHFMSAISLGLGLCWKAGIAAEVIGKPTGSIGGELYQAKLYLMTKELFAWTIVIIIISILFEKLVISAIKQSQYRRDN